MLGEFQTLLLVAEPSMLGMLRSVIDPVTARCIVGSIPKDLYGFAVSALQQSIE